jgi:hypothetical protein
MRAIKRRWVMAAVAVVLVIVFGVWTVQAQVLGMAAQWGGTAIFDATNAMTTTVKAALAACLANCQKVWTVATLAASATAEIAATILFYGGAIGLTAVAAYMVYKGWNWVNGAMVVPGTGYTIAPGAQGQGSMGDVAFQYGVNPKVTVDSVGSNCAGYSTDLGPSTIGIYSCTGSSYTCGAGVVLWNGAIWAGKYNYTDHIHACMYSPSHPEYVQQQTQPGTIDNMKTQITADLTGTDATAKQKARDAVTAAVGVVAPSYNSWRDAGIAPPPLPAAAYQSIGDKLAAAIPSAKTQQLTDTASPTYATNPASASMTKTDYRDAVRDGVEQALLDNPQSVVVNVPPIDWGTFSGSAVSAPTSPSDPTKKNLTTVMTTFKNAVAALPLISWASGLHVEIAGATSTLSLPVHVAGFNSNIAVNFHDYESILDFMGNSLLAMVSFAWVLWFFRGRNDG